MVIGLDQISHAMGEGGVAATTIRNDLCAREPRWREHRGNGKSGGRELGEEFGIDDDAAVLKVRDAFAKRDERAAPVRKLHLEKVARTEILDRHDSADGLSVAIDAGRPIRSA